jgi:hypothetical protein
MITEADVDCLHADAYNRERLRGQFPMVHSDTKTFDQAAEDAAELNPHDEPAAGEHGHDDHGDHGHASAGSAHGGHDEHGHDAHGHDDHGHDAHGHDAHGHDDHADHGHHAPPAPKYLVAAPARVGDVDVRTWVAYGIFMLLIVLVAAVMLAGFGR